MTSCPHLSVDAVDSPDGSPWPLVESRVMCRTGRLTVHSDRVVSPGGAPFSYDHVRMAGSVTVLAVDEWDRVAVTRQWIYTHGERQWRLPGGAIEESDTVPANAARRELAEETGLTANLWEPLTIVHGADTLTNHEDHLFIATDLAAGPTTLDSGEVDLTLHWVPFDQLVDLVVAGEMPAAGSAHAVLLMAVRRATTGLRTLQPADTTPGSARP